MSNEVTNEDLEHSTPSWVREQKEKEELALATARQELGINKPEDIFDKEEKGEAKEDTENAQEHMAKQAAVTPSTTTAAKELENSESDEEEDILDFVAKAQCIKEMPPKPVRELPFVIKGILPEGSTAFITRDNLEGKSFMIDMARACVANTPLLDHYAIEKPGEMYYLHDEAKGVELTLMQENDLLPADVAGLRYQTMPKEKMQLRLKAFEAVANTIHPHTSIIIDGTLRACLEMMLPVASDLGKAVCAIPMIQELTKFGEVNQRAVIIPLCTRNRLENRIAKEVMEMKNRHLVMSALLFKKTKNPGEFKLEVYRHGMKVEEILLNFIDQKWQIAQSKKRGRKPKTD